MPLHATYKIAFANTHFEHEVVVIASRSASPCTRSGIALAALAATMFETYDAPTSVLAFLTTVHLGSSCCVRIEVPESNVNS